jgi:hypothetical protein
MIKNFIKFINENNEVDPLDDVRTIKQIMDDHFILTYNEINDLMDELVRDLYDFDYVSIYTQFIDEEGGELHPSFEDEVVKPYIKYEPSYIIQIGFNYSSKSEEEKIIDYRYKNEIININKSLEKFKNILDRNFNCEFYDAHNVANIDNILVIGKTFIYNYKLEKYEEIDNIDNTKKTTSNNFIDEIVFRIRPKRDIKIQLTNAEICKMYEWGGIEKIENDELYFILDKDDAFDIFGGEWANSLKNGFEYWDSDYRDHSIRDIMFELDSTNSNLLIREIINEFGGYDKVIEYLEDNGYPDISNYDLSELVVFIRYERYLSALVDLVKQIKDDFELLRDINDILNNYYDSALRDESYKELIKELERVIDAEKTISFSYTDDNDYLLKFNFKWFDRIGYNLEGQDLVDIFKEFIGQEGTYKMEPKFPDYGSIDSNDFNSSVYELLS